MNNPCTEQVYREVLAANVQLNAAVWSLGAISVVMLFIIMALIYMGLPLRRSA